MLYIDEKSIIAAKKICHVGYALRIKWMKFSKNQILFTVFKYNKSSEKIHERFVVIFLVCWNIEEIICVFIISHFEEIISYINIFKICPGQFIANVIVVKKIENAQTYTYL